ncbi:NFAT activation molecule 1 isoform X2 [Rhineura floridana]|uniref:NFAT activation molecule 1 isoform X2 n=1 Tax=Rhineura floridana TaxID=261503 RepID=UPI002AC827BF|nr:NFAT activation molecule 1 isoform X2 [Rhineura floridana]
MASCLYIVISLFWTLQYAGTLHVYNNDLIQIAFANEEINAICKISLIYKPEYMNFNIRYYRIDLEGKETTVMQFKISENLSTGPLNKTKENVYSFSIKPAEHASVSGTYICEAEWTKKVRRGNGTFTLFKDKGYTEPSLTMWKCLITIIIVLAALSIAGTALVFWKREMVWPGWSQIKKFPAQGPAPQHASGSSEPPETPYAELGPRESGIYFAINKSAGSLSHKKMPAIMQTEGHF